MESAVRGAWVESAAIAHAQKYRHCQRRQLKSRRGAAHLEQSEPRQEREFAIVSIVSTAMLPDYTNKDISEEHA
jgi:hypothetical protein